MPNPTPFVASAVEARNEAIVPVQLDIARHERNFGSREDRGAAKRPTVTSAPSRETLMRLLRAFHDLGQRAAHVLGVEEEDRRAMRPDPRIS